MWRTAFPALCASFLCCYLGSLFHRPMQCLWTNRLLFRHQNDKYSDNCLARLSQEIARAKAPQGATVQEVQKPEPAPVEEKPKKKRGRKPKAEKAS